MKKAFLFSSLLALILAIPSSWADSPSDHLCEKQAIALGLGYTAEQLTVSPSKVNYISDERIHASQADSTTAGYNVLMSIGNTQCNILVVIGSDCIPLDYLLSDTSYNNDCVLK